MSEELEDHLLVQQAKLAAKAAVHEGIEAVDELSELLVLFSQRHLRKLKAIAQTQKN